MPFLNRCLNGNVLVPAKGIKMAKSVPKIANVGNFLPVLGPLGALKHYHLIISSRGGSKLQFGGPNIKIG